MNNRLAQAMLALFLTITPSALAQSESARAQAYEALRQENLPEAANQFEQYLDSHPQDLQAGLDYAEVLTRLQRQDQAVAWLQRLHRLYPEQEPAQFRLATQYANLKRYSDAEPLFAALELSANKTMARAAAEARRRLQADRDQEEKFAAETRLFYLAAQGRHQEVVNAANALEQRWDLAYPAAMQRLYALYNLQQFNQTLLLADALLQRHPQTAELAFLRAESLVQLKRPEEALALWRKMESDHPGTPEAAEARRRRLAHEPHTPPPAMPPPQSFSPEEDRIYALARQEKNREVVEAIDALERQAGKLSWPMALQRLYALFNLRQYQPALDRTEMLSRTRPGDVNLAFLRAELLRHLDRTEEAIALWRQIERDHPDTPHATEAAARRRAHEQPPPPPPARPTDEDRIFALAEAGRHREVIAAVDELENRTGQLSWPMEMQRLYAMQSVGDTIRARHRADRLAIANPDDPHLALIRADLLLQTDDPKEAGAILSRLRRAHAGEPLQLEADRRLRVIPPIANPDKWHWGEAYFSGDYFGRFGALVGSGLARQGTFIPQARWLQPYAEFRFGIDTETGIVGERTIVIDNQVGFYGGVRAQMLPSEYLFLYAQGGVNQDLLDIRESGDWAYDYQAGIYGFKSWGPGTILHDRQPAPAQPAPGAGNAGAAGGGHPGAPGAFLWRGDWFLDGAADFSYYHRYASWIGYGQAHEGFRLFQVIPGLAFDLYLVENLSWDVKGNYFDNLVEVGPGARWLWKPCWTTEIILRAEWLNGFYFGRDNLDRRGGASGQYDEVRVGFSVGLRW